MDVERRRIELDAVPRTIIGCSYTVGNTLGCGFLEKVYENALAHEIRKAGYQVVQQAPVSVYYDGVQVGEYVTDLLVADCVLVELKAVKEIDNVHRAQCHNYLNATGLQVCLLINFGSPRVDIKRIVRDF